MTEPLDMSARYAATPDAVESRLGKETVILHLGSGTYFGLDPVGTVVWERLKAGDVPRAICAHVRAVFADAPDSVEGDVASFLEDLAENGLIEPA